MPEDYAKPLSLISQSDSRMSNFSKDKLNWIVNQNYSDIQIDLKSLQILIRNAFSLGYSCGRNDVGGDE